MLYRMVEFKLSVAMYLPVSCILLSLEVEFEIFVEHK
jgi:hypothetical protein